MKRDGAYWIEHLHLTKHVEGGYYREIYKSSLIIPGKNLPKSFNGDRPASTSIYFLLGKNQFSSLHRIASDELWHFYAGDCLLIYEFLQDGGMRVHKLGNNPEKGESLQVVIGAGNWFGARPANGGEYALTGCTVAPGFDFSDFELAKRAELVKQFPKHQEIINALTRE